MRVETDSKTNKGEFVPRTPSGFQVKKPDMGPAAIKSEMAPGGVLRPVIGDLADANGSYIIVSAQGSVADKPLRKRREAMADAVKGHARAAKIHLDFFDRDRLATWVNRYPGVAAWVRQCVGRALSGWQSVGDWSGTRVGGDGTFIADDTACLIDGRSNEQPTLSIIEGIDSLRKALAEPGQCIRLIGMSGLGKTRFVQALFESKVGENALDPSLAIYTDYSETPEPTAKQMALRLVETGQRAILVIDNCNPQTHGDLAKICGSSNSKLSLITVEYDVRDDEPERTDVFRLQSASDGTITAWLKANFHHVTQVDRDRIAEFSGGNFRVAGVLAETIKKGDSLGNLKDRELFRRIFQQRSDHSDELLQAAETLALVYSFDGEDTSSSGELALLANLAGFAVPKLYGFVAELKSRSVIQSRGRWRALLPHAIANRLAAQAFERIPPDRMDSFCAGLPLRLKKSFSRRLGCLHDNEQAMRAVQRWVQPDGPLGDLLEADDDAAHILRNIAPVAPEAVLRRIEAEIEGPSAATLLHPRTSHRWQLTMILKSLAYTPDLFDRATKALARFVAAETPDENHNSARGVFQELFHLHLSGTLAPPSQRRAWIQSLYEQGGEGNRIGNLALDALLESGHFSSSSNFDFGARPRDFGWRPRTYGDIWNWYRDGVSLAVSLSSEPSRRADIRTIVSGNLRGILGIKSCLEIIEGAVEDFLNDGEWVEGWLAIRGSLRFDGEGWQPTVRERIEALEAKLRPIDPLNIARAYVMEGRSGFDLLDGDKSEEQDLSGALSRLADKAEAIGRDFGSERDLLQQFLPEVLSVNHAPRAFAFGMGLAASEMPNVEMWAILRTALLALPLDNRNASVLGGFIRTANEADPRFGSAILDEMSLDPEMAPHFVYLQAIAGIDEKAIARLRRAIALGHVEARYFYNLVSGVVASAPQSLVASMLDDLSVLPRGNAAALEILHMALYALRQDGIPVEQALLDIGHELLLRLDYSDNHEVREYRVQQTISDCYAGPSGEQGARELCQHIKGLIADKIVYAFSIDHVFDALFEVQPIVALDEFMLGAQCDDNDDPIYGGVILHESPLEKVKSATLWSWADQDAEYRYPLIGRSIGVFATDRLSEDAGLSTHFLEGVDRAPDRAAFLSSLKGMHPSGWTGNLSAVLDRRVEHLQQLTSHADLAVRTWTAEQTANLKRWADREREREAEKEETFE